MVPVEYWCPYGIIKWHAVEYCMFVWYTWQSVHFHSGVHAMLSQAFGISNEVGMIGLIEPAGSGRVSATHNPSEQDLKSPSSTRYASMMSVSSYYSQYHT